MPNKDHLDALKMGHDVWNAWRRIASGIIPDLSYADLSGMKFDNFDFSNVNFQGSDMAESSFTGGTFKFANFADADLRKASFTNCKLSKACFQNVYAWGCVFDGSDLLKVDLRNAIFVQAKRKRGKIKGANCFETDFAGADMEYAVLDGASLVGADLSEANLCGASLKNARLDGSRCVGTNFFLAKLGGAVLRDAKIEYCDLTAASLRSCECDSASFRKSKLTGATFVGAKLEECDFTSADVRGIDLRDATFRSTYFSSKSSLNDLAHALSSQQIFGIVFVEDEKARKERRTKGGSDTKRGIECLAIRVDSDEWTPGDMSYFLMATQLVVNKIQYLSTTKEQDEMAIRREISGYCYPGIEGEYIRVHSLSMKGLD